MRKFFIKLARPFFCEGGECLVSNRGLCMERNLSIKRSHAVSNLYSQRFENAKSQSPDSNLLEAS